MNTKISPFEQYFSLIKKTFPGGYYRSNDTTKNDFSKEELLRQLYEKYKNCTHCPLATQGRSRVVFGRGSANALLMFVGEGPGAQEDALGKPFVGRAGALLSRTLKEAGITENEIFISNAVKCRPPENRTPLSSEVATCTNILLFREIEIIKPRLICTLGLTASQIFLGEEITMGKIRGKITPLPSTETLLLPTYHPAYILRNPQAYEILLTDIKKTTLEMTAQKP